MAEWEALLYPVFVGRVNRRAAAQAAPVTGGFSLHQVAPPGARAQNFSARGNFEPLGRRLFSFDAFWTSHSSFSFLSKRARNIGGHRAPGKPFFGFLRLFGSKTDFL
jgi:hypothetical protein